MYSCIYTYVTGYMLKLQIPQVNGYRSEMFKSVNFNVYNNYMASVATV